MSRREDVFELCVLLLQIGWTLLVSIGRTLIPHPCKSVREKVVLVTGSGSGLGREVAQKMALLGARVVLVDIDEARNAETLQKLRQMQCKGCTAHTCDVSREDRVAELAARVGHVDILVNNAAVMPGKPLLEVEGQQIRQTFETNTVAHFWTIRQFLPRMLERGEGHVVAISSLTDILGGPYLVDYCASQSAVDGLMFALQEELHAMGRGDQIFLTTICLGLMNTGLAYNPRTRFPALLPILDVDRVSDIVVQSILRNERRVTVPTLAHWLHKVSSLLPPEAQPLLNRYLGYTIDPNIK